MIKELRAVQEEDGQDLIEYALLVGLIAIIAAGSIQALGVTVLNVFWNRVAGTFGS